MESIKILVIDDETTICDGCRMALSAGGYAVDTCLNGRQGLETLSGKDYDLVLLDIKLPDMDGMEILRILKKNHPRVYVIVMTGY